MIAGLRYVVGVLGTAPRPYDPQPQILLLYDTPSYNEVILTRKLGEASCHIFPVDDGPESVHIFAAIIGIIKVIGVLPYIKE